MMWDIRWTPEFDTILTGPELPDPVGGTMVGRRIKSFECGRKESVDFLYSKCHGVMSGFAVTEHYWRDMESYWMVVVRYKRETS
jgi:hypothetical protein